MDKIKMETKAVKTASTVVKNDFMSKGILLLGTNLGDKYRNLRLAMDHLRELCKVLNESHCYESPAWGYDSESTYINQAVEVHFEDSPEEFMSALLETEQRLGRTRQAEGYTDRIIDIDILAIEGFQSDSIHLQVPHPRLNQRLFALLPMQELWPFWTHERFNKSISELITDCNKKDMPIKV